MHLEPPLTPNRQELTASIQAAIFSTIAEQRGNFVLKPQTIKLRIWRTRFAHFLSREQSVYTDNKMCLEKSSDRSLCVLANSILKSKLETLHQIHTRCYFTHPHRWT